MTTYVFAAAVTACLFAAFAAEWRPPEISAGVGVCVLLVLGVIDTDDLLGVLSSSAPATIEAQPQTCYPDSENTVPRRLLISQASPRSTRPSSAPRSSSRQPKSGASSAAAPSLQRLSTGHVKISTTRTGRAGSARSATAQPSALRSSA